MFAYGTRGPEFELCSGQTLSAGLHCNKFESMSPPTMIPYRARDSQVTKSLLFGQHKLIHIMHIFIWINKGSKTNELTKFMSKLAVNDRHWNINKKLITSYLRCILQICMHSWLNSFPHTDAFWHLCSRWLLKTLWQKKKLLKTSKFLFRYNVFKNFSKYNLICSDFLYFCPHVSKVVLCRFVVFGKVLNENVSCHVTKDEIWVHEFFYHDIKKLITESWECSVQALYLYCK